VSSSARTERRTWSNLFTFRRTDFIKAVSFLLLVHAITYEPNATERESILFAVEKEVGTMFRAVDDTINEIKRRELAALKGGAR
jgi:hypothetical protein